MATRVRKKAFGMKLTDAQLADVKRAAELESARRRDTVHESSLFRELGMSAIWELLAQHGVEPQSAPTVAGAV